MVEINAPINLSDIEATALSIKQRQLEIEYEQKKNDQRLEATSQMLELLQTFNEINAPENTYENSIRTTIDNKNTN